MTYKDPKDILRTIRADIEGISPKDIEFKDLRKEKRGRNESRNKNKKNNESEKQSDIIANNEDFSITEIETDFCSYGDIYKKRKIREKDTLEEWGPFDFFRYAHNIYINKYGRDWDLNIAGNSVVINRIRDKFYDLFGFCCNLIMKDYINFFFDEDIDEIIKKGYDFNFMHMLSDYSITSFYDNYNFSERFADYTRREKKQDKKQDLTKKGIKEAFLIGDSTLIGNYGIVIAFNWMLMAEKIPNRKATEMILVACKEMNKKGIINIVKNSTEFYSPYPLKLVFKSPQLVMDKIDKNIKLKVKFIDSEISFL